MINVENELNFETSNEKVADKNVNIVKKWWRRILASKPITPWSYAAVEETVWWIFYHQGTNFLHFCSEGPMSPLWEKGEEHHWDLHSSPL